jgi:hypothetical protein
MPLDFDITELLYNEFMRRKTQNIQSTQTVIKPLESSSNQQDFQIYRSYSEFEDDFANIDIPDDEIIRRKI